MSCVVAHFRTPFLSFSETFIYSVLSRLNGGFRPVVFTTARRNEAMFPFAEVVDFSLPRFSRRWWTDRIGARLGRRHLNLERLLRERDVGLLHAHFGEQGYELLPVKRRLGVPLVTTFYGYDVSELPKDPLWRRRYLRLFREGDLFLVEGGHMRAAVVALGCPEEKVRVQRIGVDLEAIRYRERPPKRAGERTIFLFCGRFVEKKGLIYALRAFDRLRRRGRDGFEFRVIGDGPLRGEAEAFVRSCGLEDRVRFLGVRSHAEFREQLDRADVFVSPSVTASNGDSEGGAPTTVREAQAAGLPVLSTLHADIPEVVSPGRSALLSPERDHLALARDAERLLDDHELRRSLGREGRRQAEKVCDLRKEVRRLEDHYLGLLAGRGGPRRPAEGKGDLPHDAFYNGAWRYLVEPSRDRRLLLLGGDPSSIAGMGGEYRRACCLPLTAGQAMAWEKLGASAPADVLPPPVGGFEFPDGFFSLIAVPDWEALRRTQAARGRPWCRASFLSGELRRLLDADGELFVGIRKGNLKDWLTLRRLPPRGLLALARVFRGCRVEAFRLRDDLDGSSLYAVEPLPARVGFWTRLLLWAGLLLKARALALRIRPGAEGGGSLLRRVARAVSPHSDGDGAALYLGSGSAYRVVSGRAVIRIPDNPRVTPRCWNNYRMLRELEGYSLPFETPRPLAQGELEGAAYFAETLVPGVSVDYLNASPLRRQRLAARALDALGKFQSATRVRRVVDGDLFARLFAAPLEAARGLCGDQTRARLDALSEVLRGRLLGRSIVLTAVHGDFKVANLLWTPEGRVAGVVDWDMSSAEGLPAVDHLTYRAFEASLTGGRPMARALHECAAGLLPGDLPAFLDMEMLLLKAQGVLALIHYALHRAVVDREALERWCRLHLDAPLRQAADEIIDFWASGNKAEPAAGGLPDDSHEPEPEEVPA